MSGIAVLGAGAYGTALAVTLARAGQAVTLWSRDPEHAADMSRTRENRTRLPGVRLPDALQVEGTLREIDADCLLLAVPVVALRGFLAEHGAAFGARVVVSCAKGIDRETGLRPSQLVALHCPGIRVAALTGPSFADDIAAGLPTALTLAAPDDGAGLQARLSTPVLRLYLTHDLVGAELGGALKNVIALAAGITIGAGLGESARAAVVTRGFAEITRFALSEGAAPETLAGLSGLGDLLLTSTSPKSRNFAAGLAVGRGQSVPGNVTIEGLATAEAITALAAARVIDMPLSATVAAVTHGRMSVAAAVDLLMSRPLRKE